MLVIKMAILLTTLKKRKKIQKAKQKTKNKKNHDHKWRF